MIEFDITKKINSSQGQISLSAKTTLKKGEILAVFGASGIGKTTLLRIIAGLEKADEGTILVNHEKWLNTSENVFLPPQERQVGFVFQDYALFPNMTIYQNLKFANNNQGLIADLLKATNLEQLCNKRPTQLSGGQQQRVALARALVMQPKVLIMDEPLAALDLKLRAEMQALIRRLHDSYKMTTILVSHDVPEILTLADKLLVLEPGKSILFKTPKDYFLAENMLSTVEVKGEVVEVQVAFILVRINGVIQRIRIPISASKKYSIGDIITIEVEAYGMKLKQAKV